jgi:serine phosphatase RsbU (regulator of sigma subunit)
LLSRIVLADVAGHGQAVSATTATFRNLLRKHMNTLDQSVLLQEMNEALCREDDREKVQCATAAVFSNFYKTRDLISTNAGHPFALWHDATGNTWDWPDNKAPYRHDDGRPLAWNRSRVNRQATGKYVTFKAE